MTSPSDLHQVTHSAKLSVVMPVYNEQEIIATVVREYARILEQFDEREFIIVNDCSTDGTLAILRELASRYPFLHILTNDANRGHGPTLARAYRQATGDYVFHADSDRQFEAEDFWVLWKELQDRGNDAVVGERRRRHDPVARLVLTRFVRLALFMVFGTWLSDSNCPFRLYRKHVLDRLLLTLPEHPMVPSILLAVAAATLQMDVASVPVRHLPRVTGKSFIKSWKVFRLCPRAFHEVRGFKSRLAALPDSQVT